MEFDVNVRERILQPMKRALGQNAGWTYTLCGLKAFVQFGINLRTGLNKRLTDV